VQENDYIDQAGKLREGESPDLEKLQSYLEQNLVGDHGMLSIQQFPGGYSNLSYLIVFGNSEYVLRRAPVGANIKSAHDMGREFRFLLH
jgi:aminoglycoside phosphotransferase (APT) family kinase protein